MLWRKYVTHETIADYMEGVGWLRSKGFRIYGAVIDGMKGILNAQELTPFRDPHALQHDLHQVLKSIFFLRMLAH